MTYGYIRVSTDKQSTKNQHFEISRYAKSHGMHIDRWIEETISSRKPLKERKLGKLVANMGKDELLVVSELSRLGRSMFEIVGILNLCMQKGMKVYAIKEKYELGNTINSKVLAFAFGLAAEIERSLISQRTKEALFRKKSEGIHLGRPKGHKSHHLKLSGKEGIIENLLEKHVSKTKIAARFHVVRNTLRHFIDEMHNNPPHYISHA